jgi:hypothetical protein
MSMTMNRMTTGILAGLLQVAAMSLASAEIQAYPSPKEEPLSADFSVSADETPVPVYVAKVCSLQPPERKLVRDVDESKVADTSFASFNLKGTAKITVTTVQPVKSAQILPSSSGVVPKVEGNRITFTVSKPGQLVLEINGDWLRSLQLFIDPWETDMPTGSSEKVIYYGPGVHEVSDVVVDSGKTVYIAGGAVLYGKPTPGGKTAAVFNLLGDDITFRGRGIVDGGRCPVHTRSLLYVSGKRIKIEGVTFRSSSSWTMPVRRSEQVSIDNVKIFGFRANSDGIDLCNSRQVEVKGCYLRTFDDLVVIKTDKGEGEASKIRVSRCVLWNEFAHALSLGAELREPLHDIQFTDCDIIRDKGREWSLRVYNCDSAPVRDILFSDIRIEEARQFLSLFIGKAIWSKEVERGHIDKVTFRNISLTANTVEVPPVIELRGFDAEHAVRSSLFENVTVCGRRLHSGAVNQSEFVFDTVVTP